MVRKILDVKNPLLRGRCREVNGIDKKIREIIGDLKDTLKAQADPEGVGLAAPQIGKGVQIFLIGYKNTHKIIVNPRIISVGEVAKKKSKNQILEGCLSLPHYYGPIKRAKEITIEYLDEKGIKKTESFKGFLAQVVQHEIDHLNGGLFIDKILEQGLPLYKFDPHDDSWEEVEL